jgi:hypothetical protein
MYSHLRRSQETFTFACENVDNFSPDCPPEFHPGDFSAIGLMN